MDADCWNWAINLLINMKTIFFRPSGVRVKVVTATQDDYIEQCERCGVLYVSYIMSRSNWLKVGNEFIYKALCKSCYYQRTGLVVVINNLSVPNP